MDDKDNLPAEHVFGFILNECFLDIPA